VQSIAAKTALPILLAGMGASLPANAEFGRWHHRRNGMVSSRMFNH